MRTNIEIDDKLMADVMAYGDFKTKREAVEAGLRMLKRKKAYAALLAARGTLFWDDSDEAWAKVREENQLAAGPAQESATADAVEPATQKEKSRTVRSTAQPRKRRKPA